MEYVPNAEVIKFITQTYNYVYPNVMLIKYGKIIDVNVPLDSIESMEFAKNVEMA